MIMLDPLLLYQKKPTDLVGLFYVALAFTAFQILGEIRPTFNKKAMPPPTANVCKI